MKVFCIPIFNQFDAKLNGKAHRKVYALNLEGYRHTDKRQMVRCGVW